MHNPHLFPTEPRIDLQLGFRTAPKYKVIRVGKKLILSDFLSIRNETEIGKVSGIRESNPPPRLGKPVHYRCANSANGADTRTRTGDLRITNALLYQLSHIGKSECKDTYKKGEIKIFVDIFTCY